MILHASGFVHDGRPSSVHIAVYEGNLADVASGVIAAIKHPTKTTTVRSLGGWLREVHAYTDVNGVELWHVFSEPGEQWPMGAKPSDSEATS